MKIDYLRPVHSGATIHREGRVVHSEDRKY